MNNMLLITSSFRQMRSFSLIPVLNDCPYVECLFDPSSGTLVVISKTVKTTFHMVPKLDPSGQPMRLDKPDNVTGKTVKEERVEIETFSEHYITEKEEIEQFIKLFAINAETFDYKQFFVDLSVQPKQSKIILPK